MPGDALCSECGTELSSQELSRGLCPGCLLSLGLSLSDLETGSDPQSSQNMIGTSVSRYLILEKIGQGGMGEVFLAQDTTLNRKVALKFLPGKLQHNPSARQRFLREAKAAAALDHPYICKIHEIDEFEGRSFLSMEYVPGSNLRQRLGEGRLSLHEALKAAEELAEALGSAAQQGIVHRDLKPSNVMFSPDGHVKILDFGLAKRIIPAQQEGTEDTWFSDLTETGSILGTPAYMSPEQLQGKELDHRSDIFSLGVVLYEMATGVHPFLKDSKLETINAIVSTPFPAPSEHLRDAPPSLQRTLGKMMAKKANRRFGTFEEVRENLSRLLEDVKATGLKIFFRDLVSPGVVLTVAAVLVLAILFISFLSLDRSVRDEARRDQTLDIARMPVDPNPRVAVLPLVHVGLNQKDEILGEGLTDSLITRLANVRGLSVIAQPSVMYFKGRGMALPEIAEKLQADYILNGTFRRPGTELVVAVQLVRAADDTTVWAREYRQSWTDVLRIQSDISEQVVENINLVLAPGEAEALRGSPVKNVGAYELYLQGRFFLAQRSRPALETATSYFQQAIDLDPESALAYSGMADAQALLGATGYGGLPPVEVIPRAEKAARMALSLDPNSSEAHTSLASTLMSYHWDWEESGKHFKIALELNPGYSTAHHWYGLYLAARGDLDAALSEIGVARRLDPLSPAANAALARCLYYRREYDEAIPLYKRALELDPDFGPAHLGLALAYVKQHENSDSRIEQMSLFVSSISEFQKGVGPPIDVLAFVNSLTSSTPGEERWRDQFPPFFFAMAYTILGSPPQALEWLERAFEERSEYLVFLGVDPVFDKLRAEPAFQQLLERIGLAPPTKVSSVD